jgi:hypothetical protein
MGHGTCLDVLTKIKFIAPMVFEPRTSQLENWGILEDRTNNNHNPQHET